MATIRSAVKRVFYPWLLALYPVVYLYSVNLGEIREDDVLEVVLAILGATTLLFGLGYVLLRDSHKTGAVTSIIALVFLTYGHLYNVLEDTETGQFVLLPGMVAGAIILIIAVLQTKTLWRQLTPYLNGISAILVLLPLWNVIEFHLAGPPAGASALANPYERVVSTPKADNSPGRPDIYYIILDGYASNALWLREQGYDNSDFTDALEQRGFYVAYGSQSNYGVTLLSLASALNMRYVTSAEGEIADRYNINDYTYLRSLIANSQVADELKQLGYVYNIILSGFLVPSALADTNIAFYPEGPRRFSGAEFMSGQYLINISWTYKQPFWPFFLETTLLRPVASRLDTQESGTPYPRYAPEIFWGTFDELMRISEAEEATFTFAHIVKPHFPIQFDRDGNLIDDIDDNDPRKARAFFDELHYLNTRLLELVDYILARSSTPPIIILQGDHGSDLGEYRMPYCLYDFEILNAFYLPGDGAEDVYQDIQPVNSFRIIFNHYFGRDYELLGAEQYVIPNKCGYADLLTMAPYRNDGRLNTGVGDHMALLFSDFDDDGEAVFRVFSVNGEGGRGELLFTVSPADIEPLVDNPPAQHEFITGEGLVTFYALKTGEFQFNIGPDADGQEWAVVVEMNPPRVIHAYKIATE